MDDPEDIPENNREFFFPLCMMSLIFYSFYFIIIVWIFFGPIQYLLNLALPFSRAFATPTNVYVAALFFICLLSLVGTLRFVREMEERSLVWKSGRPLCITLGAIIFSAFLISIIQTTAVQQFFGGVIFFGFALLPLCLAYLLSNANEIETDSTEIQALQSRSLIIGLFGVVIILLLFFFNIGAASSGSKSERWDVEFWLSFQPDRSHARFDLRGNPVANDRE